MTQFTAADPNYETRIRESFLRQRLMQTIGAQILDVAPGRVTIELPFRYDLTQQNGYLHAGIVAAVVDSACGYAAMTLTPAGAEILSVEFKINLLSPAKGERFLAHGNVIRAGRTLTVCEGQAIAVSDGQEKQIAAMMATMFVVN
jgi:uncharacterized protein (TIGR00369 family)